jgi:HEAT repeat protein
MTTLVNLLAQLVVQDNAILFVGPVLRGERDQAPEVEQVADALAKRIQYQRPDRGLPAVARDFEVLRGRQGLIMALREELEKQSSDRPVPIYQLIADAVLPSTKILTTRFDRVLEQALDQFGKPYVLIVRDTDVPFFDESKVSLVKMQGDINQPDSLVITEDDVDAFISKLPTISDLVRAFFATKTLIFLGYDLSNDQFKRLFRQVTRDLSSFRRQAYAILSQPLDEVEIRYWHEQNVQIHTQDPIAFLEDLSRAVKEAGKEPRASTNPLAQLAAHELPTRPYKGLESFTGADEAIFSSRLEETYRLTNRILAHRLTVLYGQSGSGKTSLLQAGAGPQLARNRALLITCAPAPDQKLADVMYRHLVDAGLAAGLTEPQGNELPALIREWQRALDGPIILGVDQFEQFFVAYDPQDRQAAVSTLGELLNDRSLDLRLVLVVREDFLGRLQTMEKSIPGLLDYRFRLERLGREATRAAIEEPARHFNVGWEPALVDRLLDDLAEGEEGGVAPPQLQIVCDYVYRTLVEEAEDPVGDPGVQITLAQFQALGGTSAILGQYMDRTITGFPPDQQPAARRLLGSLVSSSGVKQRLGPGDLARAADLELEEAAAILDELTQGRLVRRYAPGEEVLDQARVEYDLAHDYLVVHIARWLGDDFWAAQKAREILRQARPEWESRGRLLAQDDLRLVSAQKGQMRFSDTETEILYAAAVSYDHHPEDWTESLPDTVRQEILLRLMEHPEPFARRHAAHQSAVVHSGEISAALVRKANADPDPTVREAAARAIARPQPEGTEKGDGAADREAVAQLVKAAADPDTLDGALEALTTVRDLQPSSQTLLSDSLRGLIQRRVWRARWRRNRPQILSRTLRGIQGGFWGLGLGMGLFLSLNAVFASGQDRIDNWRTVVQLMSLGVPIAGLMGALTAGSGSFAYSTLRSLSDREQRWCIWAIMTAVSGVMMSLGFLLFAFIFLGQPQPLRSVLAGLLIGLGLVGTATLPIGLPRLLGLGLSAVAGVATFLAVSQLGLIFGHDKLWWLLIMGAASGIGLYLGLNPGRQEVHP